ncbi:hypothetical protein [Granulicella tundricola]|uniref:Putative secreted protein n=1 Tax=Granulicella tundricola (strain ATCC BAA-1859 / DSM 23138 / MP5ACTX9) TaxID=1198114 RepID=E8WVA2_GRATM|nr:hypothetical protein [Granulicella tundricola]ADW67277.1 putative secreted protein [Granulicella tundricola MP5ACTX9]
MRVFAALSGLALLCSTFASAQFQRGFSVDFTDCTEFAGEGPISYAAAAPLVPHGFTIARSATGEANIVVRATNCSKVTVDGALPQPTVLSQIGINIVPPDGTGDINNYTLIYVSNNPLLVTAFIGAGLPAHYDPQLTYEYTAPASGNGNLYVSAGALDLTRYTIYGPETAPPPNSAVPFLANWWYAPGTFFGTAVMRQQTLFPKISFGGSGVTLYTSLNSLLGKLIGGNTFSNYSALALRGVYPAAHMEVTVSR